MSTNTQQIWDSLKESLFYFIVKRVKDEELTRDILQEVFIKIHVKLDQLKDPEKVKAWAYQITRNQIAEHFRKTENTVALSEFREEQLSEGFESDDIDFCCFENFVEELPPKYGKVISLINVEGKKQYEAAEELNLSLPNVKSRVYRAKEMLKQKFVDCCRFSLNEHGLLVGEQDCQRSCCASG
ncbi:MAG: sigma-70 family RNA polymerase sigma factor [Balneolaceae bacterium]|nr:sigma-70 family RNA polymerase sigma factor [Balneolaceae bacterium]MBO6647798.1 sigma-70 family RNA polymerase sigma factor [Balneolaceae bacterium]